MKIRIFRVVLLLAVLLCMGCGVFQMSDSRSAVSEDVFSVLDSSVSTAIPSFTPTREMNVNTSTLEKEVLSEPISKEEKEENIVQGAEDSGYVTFWFDDGLQSTYDIAYPELEESGWKAVVAVVADREIAMEKFAPDGDPVMSWEAVEELADAGWEISSHSMTHSHLNNDRSSGVLRTEIVQSRKVLEQRGFSVPSFTFPYGEQGRLAGQAFVDDTYFYWRSSSSDVNPVPAWRHLTANFVTEEVERSQLEQWLTTAEEEDGWVILGLHGILPDPSNYWQHNPRQFKMVLDVVEESSLQVVLPSEMFQRFGYAEGQPPVLVEKSSPFYFAVEDFSQDVRLKIPKIEVDASLGVAQPISGTEQLVYPDFENSPLWVSYYSSEMGLPGASLVIGHRQWGPFPKVFARLNLLVPGDNVAVCDSDVCLIYEVVKLEEISGDDVWQVVWDLDEEAFAKEESYLVLDTCTPYGTDLRRLLAVTKLIDV
ncbi:MAG: polysaccharide deacetylase family protein, partial [Patescibacteria group bacterium]